MEVRRRLYDWSNSILDRLFPARCALCGAPGEAGRELCAGCLRDLPLNPSACLTCGAPLGTADAVCGDCLQRPPPFARAVIPFLYRPPLDRLLVDLKFHGDLRLARLLGGLFVTVAGNAAERPQLLVPVPLHRQRLATRGYNQAHELARVIGSRLGLPVWFAGCERTRATTSQSLLPAEQRRRNVRGAFRVDRWPDPPAHVAVVDDVVATGSTAAELASALRRAGVGRVDLWALARAGHG